MRTSTFTARKVQFLETVRNAEGRPARLFALLLCQSAAIIAQPVSIGIKGGVTLTSTTEDVVSPMRYFGQQRVEVKPYPFGPTVDIGLPFGVRMQAEALYRRARKDSFSGPAPSGIMNQSGTRVNIWEFPLLLRYSWRMRSSRAFVVAGSTLRHVGDYSIDELRSRFPSFQLTERSLRTEESNQPIRYGVTFGGGFTWRVGLLHLEPELRYTHWTSKHWMTTKEQLEFLLGLKIPLGRGN